MNKKVYIFLQMTFKNILKIHYIVFNKYLSVRGFCMKDYIKERVLMLAEYIINSSDTVRGAAKKFNVSKSTVHKDITERLSMLDKNLLNEVNTVLMKNKEERHIRGGMATKEKYRLISERNHIR